MFLTKVDTQKLAVIFMLTELGNRPETEYIVADITQAPLGRREIEIAEMEMLLEMKLIY